jgi:phosphoadenosine phosphosulfate reductase
MKSINSFADHAPKPEWLRSFFDLKNNFLTEHTLGPMMISMFKRFLRDAELIENNKFSKTAQIVDQIGWESESAQGIILSNLAYNPQFEWYIKNLENGCEYPRKAVEDMLVAVDVSEKDAKSIVKGFKRITETPIGTVLGFGHVTSKGRSINTLRRSACSVSDPKVILYSLYKFAEACGGYYQFTLTRLLNYTIDSDGISPTQIFGLDRETMEPILIGLSAKYPDFISATFTHDLDKISLKDEKTSSDVLELFLA